MKSSDLILTSEEKPFGDQGSASRALTAKKLQDTHTVVKIEGGFAIAPNPVNEKKVTTTKEETSTNTDGGDAEQKQRFKEPANEKYIRAILPAKSQASDSNTILGSVDGENYYFMRDVELVIPMRFIKAWGNTSKPIYRKNDDGSREKTSRISYCNPQILGPAEQSEWIKFRAECLKKRKTERGQDESFAGSSL